MTTVSSLPKRIQSIDILRGIIMVIMALDHVRDFFHNFDHNPTDLQFAGTALFLTRWITHFCAPIFIFLSGTSAYLSSRKNASASTTSVRLATRGLWLIVLELTLVYFGWTFDPTHSRIILQVIWAIGCSMIFLSALVFLPLPAILTVALILIFGHDAFDAYNPPAAGPWPVFWHLLHIQGPIDYDRAHTIMVFYPLIPWIGVMAAGYCTGALFTLEEKLRNRYLSIIGGAAIVLFIVIRFSRLYGDPSPWSYQTAWWRTVLSFVNCSKYPPSLLYLFMTLGPALLALPILEKTAAIPAKIFTVYGRVPLFYYVMHIYLVHSLALFMSYLFRNNAPVSMFSHPGYPLAEVYLVWLTVVSLLYLPCLWFMRVKMKHKWWWLSYL